MRAAEWTMYAHCGCPRCTATRRSASPSVREATARAEGLLRAQLTPEQLADWERNQAFNVRGSKGSLFRLTPIQQGRHRSVVKQDRSPLGWDLRVLGTRSYDGLGIAVWPIGLQLEADWALAMLLYLQADEELVVDSGCHDRIELQRGEITDYRGKL